MSRADGDEGGGGSSETAQQTEEKTPEGKLLDELSTTTSSPGWTKVSCPCCESQRVEPLVLVKLGEKVRPETKRWLMRVIGAPHKDGGEGSNNMTYSTPLSVLIETLQSLFFSFTGSLLTFDGIYICMAFGNVLYITIVKIRLY